MQTDEEWLTIHEAAARLSAAGQQVSARKISRIRDSLRIPSQDRDGIGLVRISDVVEYQKRSASGEKREPGVMTTTPCLRIDET